MNYFSCLMGCTAMAKKKNEDRFLEFFTSGHEQEQVAD